MLSEASLLPHLGLVLDSSCTNSEGFPLFHSSLNAGGYLLNDITEFPFSVLPPQNAYTLHHHQVTLRVI